ncbi:MAG: hypothetical protein A2Y75_05390 [Candidatus Solincola sediminis]|uniref:Uncharacterized protein n=1 Tax=Candidatus Solincola sediminis TaxID=1797199 RepID=A0A1F2WG66_9ACTN|nr:MAG: hypothetical protein A2Y75_05390 [Candidatus Solincola sediminis]
MTVFSGTLMLQVANAIATGCLAVLTMAGRPANRVFVTQGEVAWDECDCGQLSVAVTRVTTTETFPAETQPRRPCGDIMMIELQVGIVRCVPSADVNGTAPPAGDLTAAAGISFLDIYDIRATTQDVLCTLVDTNVIQDFFIGDQTSTGPLGGCGGSVLNVKVAFVHCMGC